MQRISLRSAVTVGVVAALGGTVAKADGPLATVGPVLSVVAAFTGANGSSPYAGLTIDPAGTLYGTTFAGGQYNSGSVYQLGPATTPGGPRAVTTLFSFAQPTASSPYAGLTLDPAGNLFGTSLGGGSGSTFDGTVYELAAPTTPGGTRPFSVVAGLNGASTGTTLQAGVVLDARGYLYGAGQSGGTAGRGTVYQVAPAASPGAARTVTAIVTFAGTNGSGPYGGLVADAAGDLFGTTASGGPAGDGTVFELPAPAAPGGPRSLVTLATFTGANGNTSQATLTIDPAGNLYGSTTYGGANNAGTVFELPAPAAAGTTARTLLTLATFANNGTAGSGPFAAPIADAAGNLFGTTQFGGPNGYGTVYEIPAAATPGGHATLATLASLTGANGAYPRSPLVADAAGVLYGTAYEGGGGGPTGNAGVVFAVANSGYVTSVPEPATIGLLAAAAGGVLGRRRPSRK